MKFNKVEILNRIFFTSSSIQYIFLRRFLLPIYSNKSQPLNFEWKSKIKIDKMEASKSLRSTRLHPVQSKITIIITQKEKKKLGGNEPVKLFIFILVRSRNVLKLLYAVFILSKFCRVSFWMCFFFLEGIFSLFLSYVTRWDFLATALLTLPSVLHGDFWQLGQGDIF